MCPLPKDIIFLVHGRATFTFKFVENIQYPPQLHPPQTIEGLHRRTSLKLQQIETDEGFVKFWVRASMFALFLFVKLKNMCHTFRGIYFKVKLYSMYIYTINTLY